MPINEITINPIGKMNRRDPSRNIASNEVITRENMYVIGNGDDKQNKKVPGSIRYSASDIGGKYTWLERYYSGNINKTFGFNNGIIYHLDNSGNATSKLVGLNMSAYPVSETMKVADNDIMYFVDGFNGMYSHDGNIGHTWKKELSVTENFVFILSHLDRMFAFTEDSEDLYFSKTLVPTDFTDTTDAGIITIGAKRGAKIQSIFLINEVLYIHKEDSMYVLEGRTPSTFRVSQVHGVPGTPSRFAGKNVERGYIFMDQDYEFRMFDGATTKILSYNTAIGGDLTKDLPPIINKNMVNLSYATFHNNIYRCSFVESGKIVNNMEYCINTVNLIDFFTRGNNVSCYAIYDKSPDSRELITGRSDAGLIMYQYHELQFDDDDSATKMNVKLECSVNSGIRNTRFKYIWANINVLGNVQYLPIRTAVDTRLARSSESETEIATQGETSSITTFIKVSNQESITERLTLPMSNSKGQSLNISLDFEKRDFEISLSSFVVGVHVKERKRRKAVNA